jgi:hypothetical protein
MRKMNEEPNDPLDMDPEDGCLSVVLAIAFVAVVAWAAWAISDIVMRPLF